MGKYIYILFDCMETLVDLTELPTLMKYALWGFEGSGVEKLWDGFESFFEDYKLAKKAISDSFPEYKEYDMYERFELIARTRLPRHDDGNIQEVTRKLYDNYWKTYISKCYIRDDVRAVLPELAKAFRLGVVSNFMIKGGIEELLILNGIIDYFDFVVTSINEGWRKPHPHIYNTAAGLAGTKPENILFTGDDYINDYKGPGEIGMKPVFLDRCERYPYIKERVKSFYEFKEYIFRKLV